MRLLISNDDGYLADGLAFLVRALSQLRGKNGEMVEIIVVAPDRDKSGASSSLTLDRPLSLRQASNGYYYVNGTPTDCVHIALTGLLAKTLPDLVLSGINRGANMGDDTIYSGTVAAAMEGHLFGIPAMAFSLCSSYGKTDESRFHINLEKAASIAAQMVEAFIDGRFQPLQEKQANKDNTTSESFLLNVNIPENCQSTAWHVTRLGKRHRAEDVIAAEDPRGETVYWIGPAGLAQDAGEGTDFYAVAHGNVSITPLMIDLTHHLQRTVLQKTLPTLLTS